MAWFCEGCVSHVRHQSGTMHASASDMRERGGAWGGIALDSSMVLEDGDLEIGDWCTSSCM